MRRSVPSDSQPSAIIPPHNPRRGVAAVEFAVCFPVLMLMMIGIWEIGRLVHVKQLISNAAREGARAASTGLRDFNGITGVVRNYLLNSGISNTTGLVVKVTNLTKSAGPSYNPANADQLDELQIEISLPFNNVKWVFLPQLSTVTTINGKANWFSTKNVPIFVDLSGAQIPRNPI
ncbi:TadE family protein [Tuwongella immobilis]|uniref:TadE-like domain-containing protein n=1 Tax=Tuwongella immobilis TaxID=692036 RepID=A0A6C2YIT5_9BACT|nr:TadE family protein [Tuwongella immobilis]VIP00995.1 TadE-like protein OS=Singulisphaera acidiphila (strain ATCC BAA-1392 / DSM 18658 / VKM B-2454 / MOB10) GN=Sinac_7489 PE=4 SV=1: TadE [Tuwongella immobilis]VTR97413.1 TadE-like protein OS=Singulisphaera acidiphila (strain ATCC BAA-1392 / DSM 18658 / VKM B-2454 / MOB10) GN=Sinac_7489 PE=4 SV=1: TadE [Tuwongella immobilis]